MGTNLDEIIGENLRSLRESAQVSQESLANALGVGKASVIKIESGNQKITPFQLWQASELFEVEADRILRG